MSRFDVGKTPELLAPAGGWEALYAAAQSGADAVYFGLKKFSARANAENFTPEDLPRVARYCRERGFKAYLAANTLVRDREMKEFAALIERAAVSGVHAVILQDLGAARVARQVAPDLPRHASTQMTVHSVDGARRLFEEGFSRIILARELSREEIAEIAARTDGELEIFVHGALCISYSGQCLLSSMIGQRSGNRGECAQPCRLPYRIGNKSGYFLSPKDLSLIEHISTLSEIGVTSLKIEGRMKSAGYVAVVTGVFRRALDRGYATDEDIKMLKGAFCRGDSFTGAYFAGEKGAGMMCGIPQDDIYKRTDTALLKKAVEVIKTERPRIRLNAALSGTTLTLWDEDGNTAVAKAEADGPMLSSERAAAQISKLGGTPFVIDEVKAEPAPLKISTLNALRRQTVEELLEIRGRAPVIKINEYKPEEPAPKPPREMEITASVMTLEQAGAALEKGIRRVYLPAHLIPKAGEMAKECCALLPVIIKDGEKEAIKKALWGSQDLGAAAGSIAGLELARELDLKAWGGFGLNITSLFSVLAHRDLGFLSAFLSPELTLGAMRDIALASPIDCEAVIYGRVTLMINENCVLAAAGRCGCGQEIVDRRGARFPVLSDAGGCRSRIINSRPLYMADRLESLRALSLAFGQLVFTVESGKQTAAIIDEYLGKAEPRPPKEFTRGYFGGRK